MIVPKYKAFIKLRESTDAARDISAYGAMLLKGSYEALLTPAPMKEWVSYDSRIVNGTTIYSASARTASRSVTLQVLIVGDDEEDYLAKYSEFMTLLASGIVALSVTQLKTTYYLAYNECTTYGDYGEKVGKLAIKFTEPDSTNRDTFTYNG